MAEKSSFFTSLNGDRKYKATDFAKYFASFIGNGVFPNPSTNLQVTSNGDMTISLSKGLAWIDGYIYDNTDNLTLTVEHSDAALKRIDRVVLRCDFIGREIKAHVKKGIFASSPIAPSLERGVNAYEISVADVLIENGVIAIQQSKITDTRLNTEVCGIVTQTINEIDTTTLYNQLQAHIQEKSLDMDTYLKNAKDYFSKWINDNELGFNTWMADTKIKYDKDFNTWFDTIKNALDGDVAGNLLNKIIALEDIVNNLKLESRSVMRPNGKNVEESLSSNETSISNLEKKTDTTNTNVTNLTIKVNAGQNHKLTDDNGTCIGFMGRELNMDDLKYKNGFYRCNDCANMPTTSAGWGYLEVLVHAPGSWAVQTIIDLHDSGKRYTRTLYEGVWKPWRSL